MTKSCKIGVSCGSACISRKKTCTQDLPKTTSELVSQMKHQMMQFEAMVKDAADRNREERRIKTEEEREAKKAKELNEFFDPLEETYPQLTEAETQFREKAIRDNIGPDFDNTNLSPSEIERMKDIIYTGKYLGSGAFGSVYAKGDYVVKMGRIEKRELDMGIAAGEEGFGPKIYGYARANLFRRAILMERVQGKALFSLYRMALPPEFIAKVTENAYDLQSRMAENGFYHGDVHSGNMMVNNKGGVKMVDWAFGGRDSSGRAYREMDDMGSSFPILVLDSVDRGSSALPLLSPEVATHVHSLGYDTDEMYATSG